MGTADSAEESVTALGGVLRWMMREDPVLRRFEESAVPIYYSDRHVVRGIVTRIPPASHPQARAAFPGSPLLSSAITGTTRGYRSRQLSPMCCDNLLPSHIRATPACTQSLKLPFARRAIALSIATI